MDFLGGVGAGRGRALQDESPEELSRAGEAQPYLHDSLEELRTSNLFQAIPEISAKGTSGNLHLSSWKKGVSQSAVPRLFLCWKWALVREEGRAY